MAKNKSQDESGRHDRNGSVQDRKMPAWKKRNLKYLLIEPFKQVKIGVYVISISIIFLLISSQLIYQALTAQYDQVMEIFQVVDPDKQWELTTNDVFKASAIKVGVAFLVYLALLMTVVLKFTHKIYGPLVSIERFVDNMARGKYRDRIKVRDGDELGGLVAKLNKMAETLENKHGGHERRSSTREDDSSDLANSNDTDQAS